jgi:hypothetical protein
MQSIARLAAFLLASAYGFSAAVAAERFVNGDFEAGVAGFGTDYSYNGVDNSLPGQFAVVSNPQSVHGAWGIYDDHTVGGTLMMTANGSTASGMALWRQTVSVVPGADYTFSAWGASAFSSNPALLSFRANDVEFGTLQLPFAVGVWTNGTHFINAGANTSIEFEIVDLSIESFGNDLTLDDISLDGPVPVIPEPGTSLQLIAVGCLIFTRRRHCRRSAFPG